MSENGILESLQNELWQLNNELREANRIGIDVHLTHPYNTNIQDYRDGGTLSMEEVQKVFNQVNFEESRIENEESMKSANY